MRWDMCKDPDGNGQTPRHHALGHWGLTLCGPAGDDLTDLDPQWRPDRPEACPACRSTDPGSTR